MVAVVAVTALAVAALLGLGASGQSGDAGAAQSQDLRPPAPEPPPEQPQLSPPEPVGDLSVPLPEGAPPLTRSILVSVVIAVDENGEVSKVRIEHGAGPPWDEAVMAAATSFQFHPAHMGDAAVAVEVPFVARFVPPEAPPPEKGPPLVSVLSGHLAEKGTTRPVPSVMVSVELQGHSYSVRSGADGAFHLQLPEGYGVVRISAPGYRDFHITEILKPSQALEVRYLMERERYNPFETIVVGKVDRVEVSRIELRGRELTRVPGSFGDPFRVVTMLPGVGNVFSLLGYSVVRGTSPGNTGVLVDGLAIPQLFHYLAGPAVIAPAFITRVDFFPGNFPVRYGGYTGGIIDGITSAPDVGGMSQYALGSLDLLNSGLLVHSSKPGGEQFTVAGRLGYPALLLSAINSKTTASYGDYQLRYDDPTGRLTAFLYGSEDQLHVPPDQGQSSTGSLTQNSSTVSASDAATSFHRLALHYRVGDDRDQPTMLETTLGYDDVGSSGNDLRSFAIAPRISTVRALAPDLRLRTGFDGSYRRAQGVLNNQDVVRLLPPNDLLSAGVWADLPWAPTDGFVITPGLRGDVYVTRDVAPAGQPRPVYVKGSIDPRLLWRLRLGDPTEQETWLKGGVGIYSQPPRFPVSLPGLSELGLSEGLIHSYQASLGVEHNLGSGFSVDAQTYFQWLDPIFLDFTVNQVNVAGGNQLDTVDRLLQKRVGRGYGLEVMLRRRDQNGIFGWIAYTLSRSERRYGNVWKPYDFDRTHMLQVVVGKQLPRNWELGAHVLVETGRPDNGPYDPLVRLPPFWRVDVRLDKRAVFNGWMLDFYAEIINAGISPEPLTDASQSVPYTFPNLGFSGLIPW